jgi:hypothetical protein
MGYLQYKKNRIINNILIKPGIKKYTFIVKMLTNNIILIIGPYTESVNTKANILSIMPRSLENLFVKRPVGVISK